MVGVVMSYFSHSQIWALQTESGLYLGGKTNRALVTFEREFCRLVEQHLASPLSSGIPTAADWYPKGL
ncbi:MAG: cytochrome c biogenesis protein, partial [Cyanobacteriota bacterium]